MGGLCQVPKIMYTIPYAFNITWLIVIIVKVYLSGFMSIPYSTKYLRDKTFVVFAVFQQTANVFLRNHTVLLKYFNHINGSSRTLLPNPESSLSRVVNRAALEAANEEVLKVHTKGLGAKRLPYLKATPAQKALVGKYATEHGVTNSIRRYQRVSRSQTNLRASHLLMFQL